MSSLKLSNRPFDGEKVETGKWGRGAIIAYWIGVFIQFSTLIVSLVTINKLLNGFLFFAPTNTAPMIFAFIFFSFIFPLIKPFLPDAAMPFIALSFGFSLALVSYDFASMYPDFLKTNPYIAASSKLAEGTKVDISKLVKKGYRKAIDKCLRTHGASSATLAKILENATNKDLHDTKIYEDGGNYTPLGFAIASSSLADVEALLGSGRDVRVDVAQEKHFFMGSDYNALGLALAVGSKKVVKAVDSYLQKALSAQEYEKHKKAVNPVLLSKLDKLITT